MNLEEEEIWKSIPGYEGVYEVSNHGRVRTWMERGKKLICPKNLKTQNANKQYRQIELYKYGTPRVFLISRLVLTVFEGPCPEHHEASHIDGHNSNNYIGNLCWETHRDNTSRKTIHGTAQVGEKNPAAKLSEADVRLIRSIYKEGQLGHRKLGIQFGVTNTTIKYIVDNKTWKHIE